MGAVDFSSDASLQFPISGQGSPASYAEFESKVKSIPHRKRSTYTYLGLDLVPDCGWRFENDVKNIGSLIS